MYSRLVIDPIGARRQFACVTLLCVQIMHETELWVECMFLRRREDGGGGKPVETAVLCPVADELIRMAASGPLVLEATDLGGLWHCDTVPLDEVRRQLLQALGRGQFDAQTKNNLIVLCSYYLFWQEPAARSLPTMSRLASAINGNESPGALNFHTIRAKAYAESGRMSDALLSLDRAMTLEAGTLELIDAWVLTTRLSVVCRRAGKMDDALYFYRLSDRIARSADRSSAISLSEWGVAYGLVGTGRGASAIALAGPLLDGLLAGRQWVEDANLPMVPLILAKSYLLNDEFDQVRRHLSLAREMQVPGYKQYSDGTLLQVQAELLQRQGAGRAALDPLFEGMEELLQLQNLDLCVVKKSLDIYQKLGLKTAEFRMRSLRDLNESLSPNTAQWKAKLLAYRQWISALPCLAGIPAIG